MLPKLILVREEKEKGDRDTYLLAFKNLDDSLVATEGETVTVGVYKLVNIRKAKLAPLVIGKLKVVK